MQATYVILNFVGATLYKWNETGEINFIILFNTIYLKHYHFNL